MAYYEGLPIYRAAMDVVLAVEAEVKAFSRFHKYQVGARLRDAALECVRLVALAQRREGRLAAVTSLCEKVDELQLYVNVGREVKAFGSIQKAISVMEKVVVLARQAEGWRKSVAASAPRADGVVSSPRMGPDPARPESIRR